MGTEWVAALRGSCCISQFGVSSDTSAVSFYADVELGRDQSIAGKAVLVGNPHCGWMLVPGVLWGFSCTAMPGLAGCSLSSCAAYPLGIACFWAQLLQKKAFHRLD